MHDRYEQSGQFPDSLATDDDGPPVSWRVSLLDYSDDGKLKHPYDPARAWDSNVNLPSAQEQVDLYACPSNYYPTDRQGRHHTAYALMTGDDAGFPHGRGLRVKDIPSTSSTVAVAESCGHGIVWTEPRDVPSGRQSAGINLPGAKPRTSDGWISSYHDGGAHVGLFDGSVQFLSEDIDPAVLRSLVTRDTSDDTSDGW